MPDKKHETLNEKKNSSSNKTSRWVNTGILFSTIAVIILIAAASYAYLGFVKANYSVNETISGLAQQTQKNQQELTSLQQSVSSLQNAEQQSLELAKKQEALMTNWQAAQNGNVDNWYVAEAQYLTRLAQDHLQFTQNIPLAINLLTRADYILRNVKNSNILEIRQTLAKTITNLQALPQVDTTSLYLKLSAINQQIYQLPLPTNPLKQDSFENTSSVLPADSPWWRVGLNRTLDTLRKIVIIRKNDADALPLVMPEARLSLYQNIHSQLENAMWALLHRNGPVYQASLARAMVWIHQYFDPNSPVTKAIFQNLEELIKVNIQSPPINLTHLLELFDQYLAKANEAA